MEETIGRLLSTSSNSHELPSEYHASCSVNDEGDIDALTTELPEELIARFEFTQLYSTDLGVSVPVVGHFALLEPYKTFLST